MVSPHDDEEFQRRMANATSRDHRRQLFADCMAAHPLDLRREIDDSIEWYEDTALRLEKARLFDLTEEQCLLLSRHLWYCWHLMRGARDLRPEDPNRGPTAWLDTLRLQALLLHHAAPAMTLGVILVDPSIAEAAASSAGASKAADRIRNFGKTPSVTVDLYLAEFVREDEALPRFMRTHAPNLAAAAASLCQMARRQAAERP